MRTEVKKYIDTADEEVVKTSCADFPDKLLSLINASSKCLSVNHSLPTKHRNA